MTPEIESYNYLEYSLKFLKPFFKKVFGISTQYDLIACLYKWYSNKKNLVEIGTFNTASISSKWIKNGKISSNFFTYEDICLLDETNIFEICHSHYERLFEKRTASLSELSELLKQYIFETASSNPFIYNSDILSDLKFYYEYHDTLSFLSILMIFIQTKKIITSSKKYDLSKCRSNVSVYNKNEIEENIDILMKDAVSVRMLQLSIPSLLKEYVGFFKEESYKAILYALTSGATFTFVFLDPEYEYTRILLKEYNYFNSFSNSLKVIYDSIEFVKRLNEQYPGQVTLKLIRKHITCSYMQIIKKNDALFKMDVYTSYSSASDRSSFIFDAKINSDQYNKYSSNFDAIINME